MRVRELMRECKRISTDYKRGYTGQGKEAALAEQKHREKLAEKRQEQEIRRMRKKLKFVDGVPREYARRDGESREDWVYRMLFTAYLDARKCKRKTRDQYRFEITVWESLLRLRDDLISRTYEPSPGIAFVVADPVLREIFAAPFRDRVVHHFIYNMVIDFVDSRMIYDSYSCRVGKGVLMGAKRLRKMMAKAASEYHEKVYIVKLDIKSYFMSLQHMGLFERAEEMLLWQFNGVENWEFGLIRFMWRKTIFNDPTKGVERRGVISRWNLLPWGKSMFDRPKGVGVVIGNLSSQLLSNMYLDPMDRFIKYTLGYKYYGRYVDDFFLLVPESKKEQAMRDIRAIERFLAGLKLTLHPKKRYIQDINRGATFLGVKVYPNRMLPGDRIIRRYRRAAQKISVGLGDPASLVSYMGHFKHLKGEKIQKKIFDAFGWEYQYNNFRI